MKEIAHWKALSRSLYHHSEYHQIEDVVFELPNGERATFSLSNAKTKVVCVLAISKDNKIILARQFRPGPGLVLDELPGGSLEPGESWENAVRRELLEETGFSPGSLLNLGRFYESAYSAMERIGFLALNCEQTLEQKLDPNEFIQVILKPVPEFIDQIRKGLCTDAEIAWSGLAEGGLLNLVHLAVGDSR